MERKIIVQLIIQDMKKYQLLAGMEKLGFGTESGEHTTNILDIVARLMGIPENHIGDDWCDIYMDFILQSGKYEITALGQNLKPLAEACYDLLRANVKREILKLKSTFHNLKVSEQGVLREQTVGYSTCLVQFVNRLNEETEQVAEYIEERKKLEKRKRLVIEECLSLIKQLNAFNEDIIKLTAEQFMEKYL